MLLPITLAAFAVQQVTVYQQIESVNNFRQASQSFGSLDLTIRFFKHQKN